MSDPMIIPPTTAPAAAAAPPAVPPAVPPADHGEPAWLPARLEQANRAAEARILAALGVQDVAGAKAAVDAAKAAADAKKTAEERAAELSTTLATTSAKAAEHAQALKGYADQVMAGLTPEQQTAVRAAAGEDPARQLTIVTALRPTWGAPATAAPAAPGAQPPPATTAPAAGSMPPATPGGGAPSVPDVRTTHSALAATNPFAAARFGLQNVDQVFLKKA